MTKSFALLGIVLLVSVALFGGDDKSKSETKVAFPSSVVLRTNDERIVRIVTKAIKNELWERDMAELRGERINEPDKDVESLLLEMERGDPEPFCVAGDENKGDGQHWARWQEWAIRNEKMKPPTDRDQKRPVKIKEEPPEK